MNVSDFDVILALVHEQVGTYEHDYARDRSTNTGAHMSRDIIVQYQLQS